MSELPGQDNRTGFEIAVIGMAGRFPGAAGIADFWENLKNGVEAVAFLNDDEITAGRKGAELLQQPNFVKSRGGVIEGRELFDASFFGYSPREAELMDPQLRIFHECAWSALEDAGYSPGKYDGLIGLYAGSTANFAWEALAMLSGKSYEFGLYAASQLVETNYLSTRISYKLNLKGPSVVVQAACATSLVAIHWACRALIGCECDIALAGGATVSSSLDYGYLYEEGMILSADGHCRAFDAHSSGAIFGDGAGVVVLKSLEEALADRDHIYAIVKGSAVNNDGIRKVGFSAPSIAGQVEVIRAALHTAEVEPGSIGYVETHGTATILGDPIEIEALKSAFNTDKRGYCRIGSVKTNVGHLDRAAGVTGFIKTVLMLYHKQIPPSLHFENPNPKIDFANSPFSVCTQLAEWHNDGSPLRAGVSSFGIGGTNAHVILEEWPDSAAWLPEAGNADYRLLLLSARTRSALEQMTHNLADHFKKNPDVDLADAAYTLQTGRCTFNHRRLVLCKSAAEAAAVLSAVDAEKVQTYQVKDNEKERPVIFMFPGQGSQYVGMGLELYETQPLFRQELERCFEILKPLVDYDLKEILYPSDMSYKSNESDESYIDRTEVAQPVVFVFEYALAKLLMKWGVKPTAMIGHSIGEYTAACLAGVFSLADALKLVVHRGKLMQQMAPGAMLSVPLAEEELTPLLNDKELSLAAVNSSRQCVVSGAHEAIAAFDRELTGKGHKTRLLHTSHAFHSQMMEPMLAQFEERVREARLSKPGLPYISNVSGSWIKPEEAVSPVYWTKQVRSTVRFAHGLTELLKKEHALFIEVGPGKALSTFVRQHGHKKPEQQAVESVRHPQEEVADHYYLLNRLGQLWLYGLEIDWQAFYAEQTLRRISLPTYPFERRRYWLEGNPFRIIRQMASGAGRSGQEPFAAGSVETGESVLEQQAKAGVSRSFQARQRPGLSSEYAPPRDEIEQVLAGIWQRFFGVEAVGIYDDFFELGGDSLQVVSVLSHIQKRLDVALPIQEFFSRPTIKKLAEYIGENREKELRDAVVPVEEKEYYALSSAQKRIYIMQQLEKNNITYNQPLSETVHLELDKERIENTLKTLIRRHESLRTSFELLDVAPVQKIHKAGEIEFAVVHSEAGPGQNPQQIVQDFISPFDLAKAPLFRVLLLKVEPGMYVLAVDFHHIITDGASNQAFIKEFIRLYSGAELPSLRLRYKDFSQWQNSLVESGEIKNQEQYWLNEFSGDVPVLNLPTDFDRPQAQSFSGGNMVFAIGSAELERLREYAKSTASTMFIVIFAIYNVFLYKLSGQQDIVVGTVTIGRKYTHLENIIGMFVNTMALRNYPADRKTFIDFLKEVRDRTLEAFANQEYQFEDLVDKLLVARDTRRNPIFDVLYTHRADKAEPSRPVPEETGQPGQPIEQPVKYAYRDTQSKFDLILASVEKEDKLLFQFVYSAALFKRETIERFVKYFKEILDAVARDRNIKLRDIKISHDLDEVTSTVYQGKESIFEF